MKEEREQTRTADESREKRFAFELDELFILMTQALFSGLRSYLIFSSIDCSIQAKILVSWMNIKPEVTCEREIHFMNRKTSSDNEGFCVCWSKRVQSVCGWFMKWNWFLIEEESRFEISIDDCTLCRVESIYIRTQLDNNFSILASFVRLESINFNQTTFNLPARSISASTWERMNIEQKSRKKGNKTRWRLTFLVL